MSVNKCKTCDGVEPKSEFYNSSKTRCKDCWKKHFAKLKAKKEGLGETIPGKDDVKTV